MDPIKPNSSLSEPDPMRPHTGPFYRLACLRRPTKDKADGTAIMAFQAAAKDLPEAYSASLEGSVWCLRMTEHASQDASLDDTSDPNAPGDMHTIYATRTTINDLSRGKIELRFVVMTTKIDSDVLYGHSKEPVYLEIAETSGFDATTKAMERTERAHTLKRIATNCGDPLFAVWIVQECERRGIPTIAMPPPSLNNGDLRSLTDLESLATEHLYRLLHIHSRQAILDSAPIASAAEQLLRSFRASLWTQP